MLGYALMRTSARRFVDRFVGRQSLRKMESLFDRAGVWTIVLTRSLPYSVPEAIVFLAGLAGMPMGDSQKCAKGVHLNDLTQYIELRAEAARKEMRSLTQ